MKDLYFNGTFASFAQLSLNFTLPGSYFFRFLQVRDFMPRRFSGFPMFPVPSMTDRLLEIVPTPKGTISNIYNILMSNLTPGSCHLRVAWSDNLNIEIDDETWKTVLKHIHSSAIFARHRIIQCKVVHRVHWSKSKLARIFPDINSSCVKCGLGPASLSHMFWTCPSMSQFWESVFDSLSVITSTKIQPSPLIALFGLRIWSPVLNHAMSLSFDASMSGTPLTHPSSKGLNPLPDSYNNYSSTEYIWPFICPVLFNFWLFTFSLFL